MNSSITTLKRSNSKKQSSAKRQCRNENEKRRRDSFSKLITNLEDILDVKEKSSSTDENNKLDKASILHQTVLYLQDHQQNLTKETTLSLSTTIDRSEDILGFSWKPPSNILNVQEWLQIAIQSMHCFFLVVKCDLLNGEIVYVSNSISSYLGYSETEIVNHSLYEFISPCYHDQLRDYFLKDHQILERCDLSWKRCESDDYEQCTITGAFRNVNENEKYLMSIVKLNSLDRTLSINNIQSNEQFITHLNTSGRFIFVDSKVEQYLGYISDELIDRTYFDFVHEDDLTIIVQAHRLWKTNGSGKSAPYRFLTKGQEWIYLQTDSQVQLNSWTGKPESYICTTNLIQYSRDYLKTSTSFQSTNSDVEHCLPPQSTKQTSNSSKDVSKSNTEITLFLSQLENEKYRRNIHQKLVQHLKSKQDEIRGQQEEIQVIEDIIKFINEYENKHSSTNEILPSINYLLHEQRKYFFEQEPPLTPRNDSISFNDSSPNIIEDLTVERSPIDFDSTNQLRNEILIDSLFSSLPSTPFSNPSSTNDTIEDFYY